MAAPSRTLILVATVATALVATAPARAAGVGGLPWPNPTITYYSGATYPFAVREAVRSWNRSGVRIRFRRASRRRAQILIGVLDVRELRRACGGVAHLGYSPARRAEVRIFRGCVDDVSTAKVVAHELGHVLGLLHETRRCALMNTTGIGTVGNRCERPPTGSWGCRTFERVDLRPVVRRYGGRGRLAKRRFCPIWSAPAPPPSFRVLDAPAETTVTWTPPPPLVRRVRLFSAQPPPLQVLVARGDGTGACPSEPVPAIAALAVDPGGAQRTETLEDAKPPPGTYCYVAWTVDAFGRIGRRSAPAVVAIAPAVP